MTSSAIPPERGLTHIGHSESRRLLCSSISEEESVSHNYLSTLANWPDEVDSDDPSKVGLRRRMGGIARPEPGGLHLVHHGHRLRLGRGAAAYLECDTSDESALALA